MRGETRVVQRPVGKFPASQDLGTQSLVVGGVKKGGRQKGNEGKILKHRPGNAKDQLKTMTQPWHAPEDERKKGEKVKRWTREGSLLKG